ncbi:MAG: alpha-N-arabinofuranosidase [Mycobacteriales bacterium]
MSTRIHLDPSFSVADVDPRIFGSFVEHLGRCVYTGIYEPGHPSADEHGFRGDVAALTRELDTPIIRYPGGNFVSGYRWEDGVGPDRPVRLDLAWRAKETNAVGTDEFCAWTRRVGSEPMLAVNLGTRGVEAAADLVEYCNHPGGTLLSDRRRANGYTDPHGVRVWCLGNEMDGPWQIGHKTAEEYGRLATETAKAMRLVDPSIELVACGSSGLAMATFGAWEATVLEHTYEHVDYVSLHSYYREDSGDRGAFLAAATDMDRFIESVAATADFVRAKGRHKKRIMLSYDEWNVWFPTHQDDNAEWAEAPEQVQNTYTALDAVVVGSLLISLLRHADRVRMACLAQLVNVIAPIMTVPGGTSWRQPTFYPFALTSAHGRGSVLHSVADGPTYSTEPYDDVPVIDQVAVCADDGSLAVFAVNRDQREPQRLELDLRAFPRLRSAAHTVVRDDDPMATNSAAEPDRVVARDRATATVEDGSLTVVLPPLSWNLVRVT